MARGQLSEPRSQTCEHCGTAFETRNGNQCYCSARCRDLSQGLDPDRARMHTPSCPLCGAVFVTPHSDARYCPTCKRDGAVVRKTRIYGPLVNDPCSYCCGSATGVDHIEPIALGGEDHWSNFTAACRDCNSSKSATPLLLWLVRRPVTA